MKFPTINPIALSEDMRKIGIFLLLAGAVGYFIGAEGVRHQAEAFILASVGLAVWILGLVTTKETEQ